MIADVPRAGIVHRLDKDTTGLMVVAKTIPAQTRLVESCSCAKSPANMRGGGDWSWRRLAETVEEPISRHPDQTYAYGGTSHGETGGNALPIMEHFPHPYSAAPAPRNRPYPPDLRTYGAHYPPAGGRSGLRAVARVRPKASEEFIAALRKFDRRGAARHHATLIPIRSAELRWNGHAPIPQDMVDLIDAMRAGILGSP